MSRARKIIKWGLLIVLLLIAGVLGFVEWRAGIFIPAPRHDLAELTLEFAAQPTTPPDTAIAPQRQPPAPAVRVLINPVNAEDLMLKVLANATDDRIPAWLAEALFPYESAAVATYDFSAHQIDFEALLNMRRLDGAVASAFPIEQLRSEVPEIDWDPNGVQRPKRGLLTLRASVPMDPRVEEDVWYLWQHEIAFTPLEFERGHLLEAVFDNRTGGAWLVIGSLFRAFDFDLDEQESDISLSSLQFITRGRLTLDLENKRDLRIRFTMESIPEHKDKLGVLNLKIGIEDAFTALAENLQNDYDTQLTGEATTEENIIQFEYILEDVEQLLNQIVEEAAP